MKLSRFGQQFAGQSGIVELMGDLGSALNENPDMIFMGGGNPGRLMAVEAVFQKRLEQIMADPAERHSLFGIYQSPQGDLEFREVLAAYLADAFGWPVTPANIAVANGSQSAFFVLYNLLAGPMPDGTHRHIHLPLAPEYIGYADIGLGPGFFRATQPSIETLDGPLFKYHVDFSKLSIDQHCAALCVSRPTNPTGNVLTDDEMSHLDALARQAGIPLIIDGAYGLPFPNILFEPAEPLWNDNVVLMLSLSKLGLPGVRTGVVVANEALIDAYTNANTIVSLACGNLGPALAKALFRSGEITSLTQDYVTPYYRQRSRFALDCFARHMGATPYRAHIPEGAIFLWLWFPGLPISSRTLYERLKQRGVLIVPGEDFFIGMDDDWPHQRECIRVSYAQDEDTIERGVAIIADEVWRAYAA